MKFFNLIGISERAGSWIQNIYYVWKKQGLSEPELFEEIEPERVTIKLLTKKIGDKKSAINAEKRQRIIEFLSDNSEAKSSEIAEAIGLQISRTKDYLKLLIDEGIVISEGENKNRIYRLNDSGEM